MLVMVLSTLDGDLVVLLLVSFAEDDCECLDIQKVMLCRKNVCDTSVTISSQREGTISKRSP